MLASVAARFAITTLLRKCTVSKQLRQLFHQLLCSSS